MVIFQIHLFQLVFQLKKFVFLVTKRFVKQHCAHLPPTIIFFHVKTHENAVCNTFGTLFFQITPNNNFFIAKRDVIPLQGITPYSTPSTVLPPTSCTSMAAIKQ